MLKIPPTPHEDLPKSEPIPFQNHAESFFFCTLFKNDFCLTDRKTAVDKNLTVGSS